MIQSGLSTPVLFLTQFTVSFARHILIGIDGTDVGTKCEKIMLLPPNPQVCDIGKVYLSNCSIFLAGSLSCLWVSPLHSPIKSYFSFIVNVRDWACGVIYRVQIKICQWAIYIATCSLYTDVSSFCLVAPVERCAHPCIGTRPFPLLRVLRANLSPGGTLFGRALRAGCMVWACTLFLWAWGLGYIWSNIKGCESGIAGAEL